MIFLWIALYIIGATASYQIQVNSYQHYLLKFSPITTKDMSAIELTEMAKAWFHHEWYLHLLVWPLSLLAYWLTYERLYLKPPKDQSHEEEAQ